MTEGENGSDEYWRKRPTILFSLLSITFFIMIVLYLIFLSSLGALLFTVLVSVFIVSVVITALWERITRYPVPGTRDSVSVDHPNQRNPPAEQGAEGDLASNEGESKENHNPFNEIVEIAAKESQDLEKLLISTGNSDYSEDKLDCLTEALKYAASAEEPIDRLIYDFRRHVATKEYLKQIGDPEIEIVRYERGQIHAKSTQSDAEVLTKGLRFDIRLDIDGANESERIGVAELTYPDSTTGKVYELEVVDWFLKDNTLVRSAENRLMSEGSLQIHQEDMPDMELSRLKKTLDALEAVKKEENERELIYAT